MKNSLNKNRDPFPIFESRFLMVKAPKKLNFRVGDKGFEEK